MLSQLINADILLVPDMIALALDLDNQLRRRERPALPSAIHVTAHQEPDRLNDIMSSICQLYRQFNERRDRATLSDWSKMTCTFIQQNLLDSFRLLCVPPEVLAILQIAAPQMVEANASAQFCLSVEE